MLFSIVRLLRIASLIICLIVIGSFVVFAVGQTKTASGHQQEAIAETTSKTSTPAHENAVHKALDEASSTFTSPFSGIVSPSSSEWADQGVKLLLALLVYGFGLGYIARVIRVRV
ncbi:MAG: hypothetical protein ACLQBB_14940 [Solirubrobacteraceae bacterium]